jgi:hypothetical protein
MSSNRDLLQKKIISQSLKLQIYEQYRLNPYRFETVMQDENPNLEFYMSHRLSNYQFKIIVNGISDRSKISREKITKDTQKVLIYIKEHEKVVGLLTGLACKDAFFILKIQSNNHQVVVSLLENLKYYLHQQKINHASSDIIDQDDPFITAFQKAGFSGAYALGKECVFKIITADIPTPLQPESRAEMITFINHDEAELTEKSLIKHLHFSERHSIKKEAFGCFIQNETNRIVGGVIGLIYQNNLTIDRLWIDEYYRGNNYSKQLVNFAEIHAIQRGCLTASLHTMEYHAPWLYPKLGYKIFFEQRIGHFRGYYYNKILQKALNFFPQKNNTTEPVFVEDKFKVKKQYKIC